MNRELGQEPMTKRRVSVEIVPFGTSGIVTEFQLASPKTSDRENPAPAPRLVNGGTVLTHFVSAPAPSVKL